jgi:hypothetical protein
MSLRSGKKIVNQLNMLGIVIDYSMNIFVSSKYPSKPCTSAHPVSAGSSKSSFLYRRLSLLGEKLGCVNVKTC